MGDPRVWNVDQFTTTQHHQVPDYLDPSKTRLPGGYTACIVGASAGIGGRLSNRFLCLSSHMPCPSTSCDSGRSCSHQVTSKSPCMTSSSYLVKTLWDFPNSEGNEVRSKCRNKSHTIGEYAGLASMGLQNGWQGLLPPKSKRKQDHRTCQRLTIFLRSSWEETPSRICHEQYMLPGRDFSPAYSFHRGSSGSPRRICFFHPLTAQSPPPTFPVPTPS